MVPNILIRDVPEPEVRSIDEIARQRGLSRAEFLRREMIGIARRHRDAPSVTRADWERFHRATADLSDPEVMERAWS